ncbi:glycosyl transferase [Obelidium mucronatum]|nr:glycosyl transferase [Obelidium mucronatum]
MLEGNIKYHLKIKFSESMGDSVFAAAFGSNTVLFLAAVVIKLLLIPGYHSTDFEVHRNWLALTYSLPISQWYYESTSEWTLDYPPFFAWFEFGLSQVAQWIEPKMLIVSNLGFANFETIIFQRCSVIVTEFVLFYAVVSIFEDLKDARTRSILTALVFLSPGLLFVDNIHFQYNGFLYGIQLLSINAMWREKFLLGGVLYAVTMNFKHIYLYQAPAYFIFLLSRFCFVESKGTYSFSIARFFQIGISVVLVFLASFGPFIQHIPQVLSRLFPFKRGLCHAYWAPNFWALYSFADRAAILGLKFAGKDSEIADVGSLTRGLVGNSSSPSKSTFVDSLVLCGFSSFLFGWHVHEKAILLVLIPLSLVATRTRRHAQIFYLLSCAGYLSLFPLIFKATETPTKVIVLLLYAITSSHYLADLTRPKGATKNSKSTLELSVLETLYLYGMVPVYIYSEILHPFVFPQGTLQFLPLMLVSVYCAVGVLYSFIILTFFV